MNSFLHCEACSYLKWSKLQHEKTPWNTFQNVVFIVIYCCMWHFLSSSSNLAWHEAGWKPDVDTYKDKKAVSLLPQHLWPKSLLLVCLVYFLGGGWREHVNVTSLRWAALSAQQQTGDWCSSQRQSWALHRAGKLKGKKAASINQLQGIEGRKRASSSPAVATAGFLSQEVLPPPSCQFERASSERSKFKVNTETFHQPQGVSRNFC